MCTKHLHDGPLQCVDNGDEADGHTHRYEANDGSWVGPDKEHG